MIENKRFVINKGPTLEIEALFFKNWHELKKLLRRDIFKPKKQHDNEF